MTRARKRQEVIGRRGSGPFLTLEGCCGSVDDLVTIETRDYRKRDVLEGIRRNLAEWMHNTAFESIRNSLIDMAIVARVTPHRMGTQDVDNITKVVLDALKETPGDPRFLFHRDSQIVRLLVWKIRQDEDPQFNTDTIGISFRVHDPGKQMILEHPHVM